MKTIKLVQHFNAQKGYRKLSLRVSYDNLEHHFTKMTIEMMVKEKRTDDTKAGFRVGEGGNSG